MPYKSLSQQAWAHTPEGTRALGGEAKVAEWDRASKGKHLPERVGRKRKFQQSVADGLSATFAGMRKKKKRS